jgi:hypothetical protein
MLLRKLGLRPKCRVADMATIISGVQGWADGSGDGDGYGSGDGYGYGYGDGSGYGDRSGYGSGDSEDVTT